MEDGTVCQYSGTARQVHGQQILVHEKTFLNKIILTNECPICEANFAQTGNDGKQGTRNHLTLGIMKNRCPKTKCQNRKFEAKVKVQELDTHQCALCEKKFYGHKKIMRHMREHFMEKH